MAPSAKLNAFDIKIGIPYSLLSFELAIISILHLYAFPSKEYVPPMAIDYPIDPVNTSVHGLPPSQGGFMGMKAIADSVNLWDFVKSMARGFRWLFTGVKHREADISYKVNISEYSAK